MASVKPNSSNPSFSYFFRYSLFPRADICMLHYSMYGFGPVVLFGVRIHIVFHILYAVIDSSIVFL